MGIELGSVLGTEDGSLLGAELGPALGTKEGKLLGAELGAVLGAVLGWAPNRTAEEVERTASLLARVHGVSETLLNP